MVGTAPIEQPEYGGPIRSRAIFEAIRESGADVRYVAVHAGYRGVKTGPHDIAVGPSARRSIRATPYLADVICGAAIATDMGVKRRLAAMLASFAPDTILLEQVFPYLGLRTILDELGAPAHLVYSAQNVEHEMKRGIYATLVVDREQRRSLIDDIRRAELEIVRRGDLVAAVSGEDLEAFRALGARRLVLAPNGASRPHASRGALWWHRASLARWGIRRSVVFVSSAHPPNWQGFLRLVGTRLGFLPTGTSILICGSVGYLIGARVSASDVEDDTFWLRARKLGRLPSDRLAAAVLLADVVILPIDQGGGSNIKPAEALMSGRAIVGTTFAFRGYEDFRGISGVRLADSPSGFRAAILDSLGSVAVRRSGPELEAIEGLEWNARLRPLVEAINAL